MTIKIETFNTIEETLTAKLQDTWNSVAIDTVLVVRKAIGAKNWVAARNAAHALNASKVYSKNEKALKHATYAALFFGASRLTKDVTKTSIAKAKLDKVVKGSMHLAQLTIEKNLVELSVDSLLGIIDALEKKDKEGVFTLLKAERRKLVQEFASFRDTGDSMLQLISSLNTSRVSAYGFTAEAEVLGITVYKINEQLDNKICPVCQVMHGKEFRVEDARKALDNILTTPSPDDLKLLQPWVSQRKDSVAELRTYTPQQLVTRNLHIPPFHAGCRGLLYPVDEVPTLDSLSSSRLALGDTEGWRKWSNVLTSDEKDSVSSYTDSAFYAINQYLRYDFVTLKPLTEKYIDLLDKVFSKAPLLSKKATVYTGINYFTEIKDTLTTLEVGDIWLDKGYVSTTTSTTIAYDTIKDIEGIRVEIILPKGAQVVDTSAAKLSVNETAYQVLINKGSNFKVLEIQKNSSGIIEYLKVGLVSSTL